MYVEQSLTPFMDERSVRKERVSLLTFQVLCTKSDHLSRSHT
jgi:hypothetical protein